MRQLNAGRDGGIAFTLLARTTTLGKVLNAPKKKTQRAFALMGRSTEKRSSRYKQNLLSLFGFAFYQSQKKILSFHVA